MKIVYYAWSPGEGTYLFIPGDRVEGQLAVLTAYYETDNWADFWQKLPDEIREELAASAEISKPSVVDTVQYDEDVREIWEGLQYLEAEGDWPPILNREITEWLPRAVLGELREVGGMLSSSMGAGTFLTVADESDLRHVRQVLHRHGYRLVADSELLTWASGWGWQGKRLCDAPQEG